jgi:hypothetical protein
MKSKNLIKAFELQIIVTRSKARKAKEIFEKRFHE